MVLPAWAGGADWQFVVKSQQLDMNTYVQRQGRFQNGKIDVRVKNICSGKQKCWVNTVYEFCKYWGCEADEYFGSSNDQVQAWYEIKTGSIDCNSGTFMLRQQTWHTTRGTLLARDTIRKPVYEKPDSEESADETDRMMGKFFELDNVIDHVCKK